MPYLYLGGCCRCDNGAAADRCRPEVVFDGELTSATTDDLPTELSACAWGQQVKQLRSPSTTCTATLSAIPFAPTPSSSSTMSLSRRPRSSGERGVVEWRLPWRPPTTGELRWGSQVAFCLHPLIRSPEKSCRQCHRMTRAMAGGGRWAHAPKPQSQNRVDSAPIFICQFPPFWGSG